MNLGGGLGLGWPPRQESNLYLALRRRLFYPLNYGERIVARRLIELTCVSNAEDPGATARQGQPIQRVRV